MLSLESLGFQSVAVSLLLLFAVNKTFGLTVSGMLFPPQPAPYLAFCSNNISLFRMLSSIKKRSEECQRRWMYLLQLLASHVFIWIAKKRSPCSFAYFHIQIPNDSLFKANVNFYAFANKTEIWFMLRRRLWGGFFCWSSCQLKLRHTSRTFLFASIESFDPFVGRSLAFIWHVIHIHIHRRTEKRFLHKNFIPSRRGLQA